MRVAFVVNNYPPRVGGVENHVASLARRLAAEGHYVLVFTISDDPELPRRSVVDGVRVLRGRELVRVGDVLGFPPPGTSRRLRRILRRHRIDVVSVHTRFFPLTWLGIRAAHRMGLPVIHTEHGSDHVASGSALITHASRLVDLTLGRWSLRAADAVLGVSESVLDFVGRLSGREGELFYNAIEPSSTQDSPRTDRPGHLVFVGRIVPGKGWDTFVDTVATLRRTGHAVTAEMLGDGPDMPRLLAAVAEAGLGEDIRVRGRVDSRSVREALRSATLVNPTLLSEGFQTTLLEAIAEGGRVVTYPVPGAPVLAADGAPVVVTAERSGAALLAALEDLLREPPAPAAPAYVDAWTWPARAAQFTDACDRLIRSR